MKFLLDFALLGKGLKQKTFTEEILQFVVNTQQGCLG